MIRQFIGAFILSFLGGSALVILYVVVPNFLASKVAPEQPRIFFAQIEPTPLPTPSPSPDLTPVTLIIPKLSIQTAVEPVGLTPTNNMDTPKNAANVGWYMHGPKPRDVGNAVIAGHYDTPTGKPAIFYRLTDLEKGDEIEVISANAVRSIFVVVGVSTIPYDQFPNDYVFESKPGVNLNLITCGGIWDAVKKTYLDRIVVYSRLKET